MLWILPDIRKGIQPTEASAARKGARRDFSDTPKLPSGKTMSGLKELVGAPSWNAGDTVKLRESPQQTLEHQAARRKAPVAGVTTLGMVTASRARNRFTREAAEVGDPQPSPALPFSLSKQERASKDAVHRLDGGGLCAPQRTA